MIDPDKHQTLPDSDYEPLLIPLKELADCRICPRECRVDRTAGTDGFCETGAGFAISSICAHMGEEPVLSGQHGICNLFFAGCNLRCVFCQNYQISYPPGIIDHSLDTLPAIVREIHKVLLGGARGVGFVSPSHQIPQMLAIIGALKLHDIHPTFVYNTNAYDKVETVKSLEGTIDVYLPDLKYIDQSLGCHFSNAPGYPEIATRAIKEMYRQKGAHLRLDDDGVVESGLIIRHLVIPGQVENSKRVLRWIAEELSPSVHVSLMAQYHPTPNVYGHPALGRTLRSEEYEEVVDEFDHLGFYRGWVQELDSPGTYRPDFDRDHPFE